MDNCATAAEIAAAAGGEFSALPIQYGDEHESQNTEQTAGSAANMTLKEVQDNIEIWIKAQKDDLVNVRAILLVCYGTPNRATKFESAIINLTESTFSLHSNYNSRIGRRIHSTELRCILKASSFKFHKDRVTDKGTPRVLR